MQRNADFIPELKFPDALVKRRARGYVIQVNYEFESSNTGESEAEWRERIKEEFAEIWDPERMEYMLFIFHDKDFDVEGLPKILHVHVVIRYIHPQRITSVAKTFGVSMEGNIQHIKSYVDASRYLIHVTEKALNDKKTIYAPDEIYSYGADFSEVIVREGERTQRRKEVEEYVADLGKRIRMGEITIYDAEGLLVSDYGEVEWRKARHTFEIDEEKYLEIKGKEAMESENGYPRTFAYFSGAGGIGKSSTARKVANILKNTRGVHKVSVGGKQLTFDFAGTYTGERVTIADDLESYHFHFRDFFGLFDPIEYSPVKSRNKDKHWLSEYCIITNSSDLGEWLFNLIFYSEKKMQAGKPDSVIGVPGRLSEAAYPLISQAIRRIEYWVEILPNKAIIRKPTLKKMGRIKESDVEEKLLHELVKEGTHSVDNLTMGLYYYYEYAEIEYDNLFEVQDEIADKLAAILEGAEDVSGVKYFEENQKYESFVFRKCGD